MQDAAHFTNGAWAPSLSGRTFANIDPSTEDEIGQAARGDFWPGEALDDAGAGVGAQALGPRRIPQELVETLVQGRHVAGRDEKAGHAVLDDLCHPTDAASDDRGA